MQRASFRLAVTQSAGRKRSLSAHGRRTPVQTASDLEVRFAELGGYTAESRAGELLLGLGI
ncbi:hypothetical protein ACQKD0_04840, partial [Vreelandella aquamarina]|uniref:hypothetical protein n=1 Tax=Vreelandella aquamarina TaxID=77097 RepID=UPI003D009DD4